MAEVDGVTPPPLSAAPTPSLDDARDAAAEIADGAPEALDLRMQTPPEPDAPEDTLDLTGWVFDTSCQPIVGAELLFWAQDNSGRIARGRRETDADGAYRVLIRHPAPDGRRRAPRLYVRVTAAGFTPLATALFAPRNTAENARDPAFAPALETTPRGLASLERSPELFNFVLTGE